MANRSHCYLVFDTLLAEFEHREGIPLARIREICTSATDAAENRNVVGQDIADNDSYPVFITYNVLDGEHKRLRGCIGTFSPQPLERTIRKYAVIA